MCGGSSGPSAAELAAQETAARQRAQAETDRINAERAAAKEADNAKILAENAAAATADAARRARNRTLLMGLAAEEDPNNPLGTTPLASVAAPEASSSSLADPTVAPATEATTTRSSKKAARARTLIGSF